MERSEREESGGVVPVSRGGAGLLTLLVGVASLCGCAGARGASLELAAPTRARAAPAYEAPSGAVFLRGGKRSLDDDAWEDIDDQTTFALEYALRGGSGFGLDVGLSYSEETTEESGVDVTGSLLEVDLGGRYTFAGFGGVLERVHPYVQGGLAVLAAEVEGESGGITASDDDGTVGLYFGGGAYVVLGRSFLLGADVRALTGSSIELVGIDTDADYTEATVFLGWGF